MPEEATNQTPTMQTVPAPMGSGNVDYSQGNTPQRQTVEEVLADLEALDMEEGGEESTSSEFQEIDSQAKEEPAGESPEKPQEASPGEKVEERAAEPTPEAKELEYALPDGSKAKITDNATFKVKVNGKEEEVSQAELIKNYQGKIPWDDYHRQSKEQKKQLDNERLAFVAEKKRFETQQQSMEDLAREVLEQAESDPVEALLSLAVKQEKDPTKLLYTLINSAHGLMKEFEGLSEQDIHTRIQKTALNAQKVIMENKSKKQEAKDTQTKEMRETEQWILGEMQKHGITREEYEISQEGLKAAVQAGEIDLSGKPAKEIAGMIMSHVRQFLKPQARLRSIVKTVDPKLAENLKFINQLHRQVSDHKNQILPEMTNSVITEIVRGYLGQPQTPTQTAQDVTTPTAESSTDDPKKVSPGTRTQKEEELASDAKGGKEDEDDFDPLSMDDLLELYR